MSSAQTYATSTSSFFIARYYQNFTGTIDHVTDRYNSIFLASQYELLAAADAAGVSLANCTMEPIIV